MYLVLYSFQSAAYDPNSNDSSTTSRNYSVEILLHLTMIPFAWLLWDGGQYQAHDKRNIFLHGCHHIGALLILPYHIYENPIVASRTTSMFGHLWFAHAFSFIQRYIHFVPLLGIKKIKEGDKSLAMKRMRDVYAAITVLCIYLYYFADGQPGIGLNYQTIALTIMILARYILACQFCDWMRYIEIPGAIFVYMSAVCQYKIFWGIVVTACIYICALSWTVWKVAQRPSKWDPTHPAIAKVLSTYEEKFTSSNYPKGLSAGIDGLPRGEAVKSYCDSQPDWWKEKYPIIVAISANDVNKLKTLTKQDGVDLNFKLEDIGDLTAGWWASHCGHLHCLIVLLKAGLNPWETLVWTEAKKQQISPLFELKEDLEDITLKLYPPAPEPIFDRCVKCISQF